MTLRDRTRAAAGIPENDPVLAAAMAAAVMLDAALENKEYLHSVGDLAIQSGILEILGKGALPPDIWKRKLRALAAIVVTDTATLLKTDSCPGSAGLLLYIYGERLVEDLEKLGMDQATAQTLKTSADEQRNVRNIGTYPIIALERNALFEIAVKESTGRFRLHCPLRSVARNWPPGLQPRSFRGVDRQPAEKATGELRALQGPAVPCRRFGGMVCIHRGSLESADKGSLRRHGLGKRIPLFLRRCPPGDAAADIGPCSAEFPVQLRPFRLVVPSYPTGRSVLETPRRGFRGDPVSRP